MDVAKHIREFASRISDRLSLIGSDVRFHWAVRDRALFYGISIALGMVGAVSAFASYMIHYDNTKNQIRCLALNVYHEARGEPKAGQYAVAEVTMNRVHSKHYPNTVCNVVYQKNWDPSRKRYVGMFSWTELNEPPRLKSRFWKQSVQIAEKVYDGDYTPKLKGALFYHALYVKPRWARTMKPVARIGDHIFY